MLRVSLFNCSHREKSHFFSADPNGQEFPAQSEQPPHDAHPASDEIPTFAAGDEFGNIMLCKMTRVNSYYLI